MRLSIDKLKQLLDYNCDTGVFTWKSRRPGKQAGSVHPNGYRRITIDHSQYYAHRLAWLFVHGEIPDGLSIDHIDGNRDNNALSNLRLANASQQLMNVRDVRGIKLEKRTGRWTAGITKNGVFTHLGTFTCPLLARLAYEDARAELFGLFA